MLPWVGTEPSNPTRFLGKTNVQNSNAAAHWAVRYSNIHLFESPRHSIQSHSHVESAELIVMLSGGYQAAWQHGVRRGQITARAGDVVYWPGGTRREESNIPGRPMRCLGIYFRWSDAIPDLPVLQRDRQGIIRALASSTLLGKDSKVPRRESVMNGYLAAMLSEFVRLSEQGRDELVERVALHIEAHLRKPIYLDELARCAGLTQSYFCRRYRALSGHSPMDEVRRIRAEHAAGVLRSQPELPLKDVAARVGIADEHQLSKLLKKYSGLNAREIRRR